MQDKDGKTEKPTPKRLRDARKEGQIPKSQDLSSAISFTIFAFLLTYIFTYALQYGLVVFKNLLSFNVQSLQLENNISQLGIHALLYFLILVGPALLLAFLTGVIGNLIQVGFLFVTESLKPSFDRLNPVSNLKNMFGKRALFELVKNILKLGIVIYIAYTSVSAVIYSLLNLSSFGTQKIFFVLIELMREVGLKISIFLVVVGIADYVYQRYEHHQNLKMSQQELKDEFKEMEGDPKLKQERKQRHRDMISGNMQDVPDATVVITNPTHYAIAIRYDQEKEDVVPMVLVKGADHMAQKIKELAKEHDVPMVENRELAQSLYKHAEVGDPIPMDLYQAIAEILAIVLQMDERKKIKSN